MAHIRERSTSTGEPRYAVVWRDPDGKNREKWFRNRRDADRYAAKQTTTIAERSYTDDRLGKATLQRVADEWLNSLTKATPRTRAEYRRLLNTRVYPHFTRTRPIASIKHPDVAGYLLALADEGLRPQTIGNAYAPLRATLRYATRRGYITTDPTTGVSLPDAKTLGQEEFAGTYLTWPQVEAIAAEASRAAPVYGLLIRLTATTGLRAAEVAGLNVEDVHLLGSSASLSVSRTRTPTPAAQDRWTTTTTKGRHKRDVPILNPAVTAELAAYLATHPGKQPGALLFYGRDGHGRRSFNPDAPINMSEFLKRVLKPAAAATGVPSLRFHDLRHTAASLWASAGIDIFKVSRWLGHKSTAITEAVYTHLFRSELSREQDDYMAFLARQEAAAAAPTSNVISMQDRRTS
jgi:integrase